MKLEDLEALTEKATPGPWYFGHVDENLGHVEIISLDEGAIAEVYPRRDQAFIAAARTAMPLLLAVARAAKEFADDGQGRCDMHDNDLLDAVKEALQALEAEK